MPGGNPRLSDFDAYLRANNIPIDGVSESGNAPPGDVTIQFQTSATQQQKDWAAQALGLFDWRPRVPLDAATIAANFAGLTQQQKDAIVSRMIASHFGAPDASPVDIVTDLGISLPYDKVSP